MSSRSGSRLRQLTKQVNSRIKTSNQNNSHVLARNSASLSSVTSAVQVGKRLGTSLSHLSTSAAAHASAAPATNVNIANYNPNRGISAVQSRHNPPFSCVIIYNQSKHASNSVLSDIRKVWGDRIHVLQTVEDGGAWSSDPVQVASSPANTRLPGVDGIVRIAPGRWGDLPHFKERLGNYQTQDNYFYQERKKGDQVVFMAGWSALAESADTARFVINDLQLVWPGTEPTVSDRLEKIGMKKICAEVGAPTPPFVVLADQDYNPGDIVKDTELKERLIKEFTDKVLGMKTTVPGLVKSIHGGGGKGSAQVPFPSDKENVEAAITQVVNEMKRVDGLYFETRVNHDGDGRFFQLELECDGPSVAHGGRFVWFNKRLQKVVEIGLSDAYLKELSDKRKSGKVVDEPYFIDYDLYEKAREWSRQIAEKAGNNTRCTMEALVWTNPDGTMEMSFIECNRRPQVENEALALLEVDSSGNRRFTFAELMMRAKGYKADNIFEPLEGANVACHARWLHGDPDQDGMITYKPGLVLCMQGNGASDNFYLGNCRGSGFVHSELMPQGEISFTADPQLGKATMVSGSWKDMCANAAMYFRNRRPLVVSGPGGDDKESQSTYAECLARLFSNKQMLEGNVASNETFRYINIPIADRVHCGSNIKAILQGPVSDVLINGYRPGEGVEPDSYPTQNTLTQVEQLYESLTGSAGSPESTVPLPMETSYTKFSRGEITHDEYIKDLKSQLESQKGGWVTVAPRDSAQQGFDSESAGVQDLSRRNAEIFAARAGCVGYEVGGAQYQAGLIRGFSPAKIVKLGLPYNLAPHSLQRSQYVNGLTVLPPHMRKELASATRDMVCDHYQVSASPSSDGKSASYKDGIVPWFPYNFHAGNYYKDGVDNSSPQDITTAELLDSGITPIPNWVFSPKFTLDQLKTWTKRQIDLFESKGRKLHQIRIKNPGMGLDWQADKVWGHCDVMLKVFEESGHLGGGDKPIIYIHNHDFNGSGGHVGRDLLLTAQKNGYNYLVVDAAYRKSNTHNDNTIVCSALNLDRETQLDGALATYNANQMLIEKCLSRFDSRDSLMTPWWSDWAGGTEGSDLRQAKEYSFNATQINHAKELASEIFPLERAVTPFSEYKLRLGLAILNEPAIPEPKTKQGVIDYLKASKSNKLKVGGDVLSGLYKWETLTEKPKEVDILLENMKDELDAALDAERKLADGDGFKVSVPDDESVGLPPEQLYAELGFQQKAQDLYQGGFQDLSPLLKSPWVLHAKPGTLAAGTRIKVLTETPNGHNSVREVIFNGFYRKPENAEITCNYIVNGERIAVTKTDPYAVTSGGGGSDPLDREATSDEFPMPVPGEVLTFNVKVGDVLQAGRLLLTAESMKMETKIVVPEEFDGKKVKEILAPVKKPLKLKAPVMVLE